MTDNTVDIWPPVRRTEVAPVNKRPFGSQRVDSISGGVQESQSRQGKPSSKAAARRRMRSIDDKKITANARSDFRRRFGIDRDASHRFGPGASLHFDLHIYRCHRWSESRVKPELERRQFVRRHRLSWPEWGRDGFSIRHHREA